MHFLGAFIIESSLISFTLFSDGTRFGQNKGRSEYDPSGDTLSTKTCYPTDANAADERYRGGTKVTDGSGGCHEAQVTVCDTPRWAEPGTCLSYTGGIGAGDFCKCYYDGVEPAKVGEWVEANIGNAWNTGNDVCLGGFAQPSYFADYMSCWYYGTDDKRKWVSTISFRWRCVRQLVGILFFSPRILLLPLTWTLRIRR